MACVISNSETNVINAANATIGKIKRCSLADKDYFYHCMVTFCRCRFKTKEDLKYHQTCHNLEGKNFKCPQCSVVHGCWNDMKCHLWKEHSVDIDLITCEICGYKTDCVNKLESHKLCHGTERAFSCDQCDKSFKQAGSLRNHMLCHVARQDKTTKHKVECEVCHLFFLNRSVLRKHKSNEHGQVEFYSCRECLYGTESQHQFQRHLQKHVEKIYVCDQCDFKTKRSNNLKEHLMTHTGEKPYHCHLCCYATIRLHHFKLHLKKYHPENAGLFECSLCIFTTLNYEKFLKHVNKHKGSNSQESINNKSQVLNKILLKNSSEVSLDFQNKKDQKFVCHLCSFETKRKDTFKSHTMMHTGKKPYKCLFCNYTAIQASHYKLHFQKQHPGSSAILQCNYCIFSTYKFDTYEKHVQSHLKGSKEILFSENNNLLKDANNEVIIELQNSITFSVSDIGHNSLIANTKFNEDFELAKINTLQMKNKAFKCAYCSFSFLKLVNYKEHLKTYHNRKSGLFKCNSCSFQTLIFSQFLKHQDIHEEHCDNNSDEKEEEIKSEDKSQEDCDQILVEQCSENTDAACQLSDGLETTIIPIHPLLLNLETAVADASSSVLLLTIPKEECDQF